jgi:hypothetical protein
MPEEPAVLEIDKPHVTVILYENVLKIDLKGTTKNEIEDALESKPVLRETLGNILGLFVPLHIRLTDIHSAKISSAGKVKLDLHHLRDVTLPLEGKEAEKLVDKLNELIPKAKEKELMRMIREARVQKMADRRIELGRAADPGIMQASAVETPEVSDDLEKGEERDEQKEED